MSFEERAKLVSLFNYLEDEFQRFEEVRVRIRQLSTLQKSPDLEQDYDPQSNDLHSAQGVIVKVASREYFFPLSWALGAERKKLDQTVQEIHQWLESKQSQS